MLTGETLSTGTSSAAGWLASDNVGWGSNPRYNQMAVNVIVYALTQEGSITQRLMQGVN